MKKYLVLLACLMASPAWAQQTTQTFSAYITSLPAAATIATTDTLYVLQAGNSRKGTFSQVVSLITQAANTYTALQTFNGGATIANNVTLSGITGSSQCLQVNSSGLVAGVVACHTLTGNSDLTSGFTANQFLYSDGNKLQAGTVSTGLSFSGGNLTLSGSGVITTCGASASQLLYNNAGSCAGTAGVTLTGTGQLTMAAGSIATSQPGITITQTWNAGGIAFTGLLLNITNTASAATSKLFDFQIGGNSVLRLTPFSGDPVFDGAISNYYFKVNGSLLFQLAGGNFSLYGTANNQAPNFNIYDASSNRLMFFGGAGNNPGGGILMAGIYTIGFASNTTSGDVFANFDTLIGRNAAGVTMLTTGATGAHATGIQVYNNTDAITGAPTNYERGVMDFTTNANVLTVGTQKGGTGSVRNLELVVGGTNELDFGVTTASTWTMSGNFNAPGIASLSANTTAYVCWTTGTGAISRDSTTCLASLGILKKNINPFTGALAEVMALKPSTFEWKEPMDYNQSGRQLGFIAEDVAGVDRKLASYSSNGSLHGWQQEGMIALLVRAIQEQQEEINALRH